MSVIQYTRNPASFSVPPMTETTWLSDFNDVDAEGMVIAEPESIEGRTRVGDLVLLTDRYHFCQGLVIERHSDYVMVRPNWATWRGPSVLTTSASPHWFEPSSST